MSGKLISLDDAATKIRELIADAARGEEIIIDLNDGVQVRLIRDQPQPAHRVFGQHRGKIRIADDFDEPLPDSFWLGRTE